jgi:hypothetical protein
MAEKREKRARKNNTSHEKEEEKNKSRTGINLVSKFSSYAPNLSLEIPLSFSL